MNRPFDAGGVTARRAPLTMRLVAPGAAVVGRASELAAVSAEVAGARAGELTAVTLEGEPGIGKSRLILEASRIAGAQGFVTVAAAADEELRGPFLLARSVLTDMAAQPDLAPEAGAAVHRALDALTGQDDPGRAGLSPDEQLLRVFDLGAMAVGALVAHAPLALLLDDLQWADDDSVRLLRYVIRSMARVPLFVAIAMRPEEAADSEAAHLLADMERLGVVRRLRLGRMTPAESAELLRAALAGAVEPTSAATMHAQAEGVPFILQELAWTYRDAGMLQEIDGTWQLLRHADRLMPSAVRSLIHRRAARLPEPTRAVLGEAAVVGRTFGLRDLVAVRDELEGADRAGPSVLADRLAPAVAAGLLLELPSSDPADYRFAHEQVQEFAAASLTLPRRRAIHHAVVDLLTAGGDPDPSALPLVARHALQAGDADRAARWSNDAARAALTARAPEEALRVVELALPQVATPEDRVALLTARDDALEMLGRPADRAEGLAELTALTEALGQPHLELETTLRRAAALRLSGDEDRAAELASQVRDVAAERGDRRAELAACLELGQDRLRRPLGESFSPPQEADLDGAEDAFGCVCALAREAGDRAALAAAIRELGVIANGRVRAWYADFVRSHGTEPLLRRLAAGEDLDHVLAELDVAPLVERAGDHLEQAIELYDELGDQRGMMSAIIAMAYLRFGPEIHLQASARRIEEIRHLATQLVSLSRESERDRAEAQMLYGVHVFARAKVVPDLALSRGAEAFEKARLLGERTLEFLSAGGVAMAHLELGDTADSERWLDRAAAAAAAAPTPFKARQLALWRGSCLAAAGDRAGMREQLQHAAELAESQRRPAASCEARAQLALEAARLGAQYGDTDLLDVAEAHAAAASALLPSLPGHPLWGARADAARVHLALARGDEHAAACAARRAMAALAAADLEDLVPDIRLAVGKGLLAGGTEVERHAVQAALRDGVVLIAQRILDECVRAKWFLGPLGRELTELVGASDPFRSRAASESNGLDAGDAALLRQLVEGRTDHQIATALDVTEPELASRLTELYARIGSASRAQATSFAFRERVV